jgi:phospholipase/lecithinase/hemolysin
LPGPVPAIGHGLSSSFNSYLAATLEAALGVRIARPDVFALLNTVVAVPETFDITNVTDSCLTFVVEDFLCDKPKKYLVLNAATRA